QPGKLNAAAANGNADFLLFGFLKSTGLQVAKVPYRDILQAPNDLAEGRIQVLMTSFAVVQPQMQTGKVKVLVVTSRKRAPTPPRRSPREGGRLPGAGLGESCGIVGATRHAERIARTHCGCSWRGCRGRSGHRRAARSYRSDRQCARARRIRCCNRAAARQTR